MKTLLCALALSALTLLGADVTGKWTGTFEMASQGETHSGDVYVILKQDGGKITGSMGPTAEQQFPIKNGTIEDNRVHLEVTPDQGPSPIKMDLKLDGDDHLLGDLASEDGGFKGKIDVKREK